MDHPPQDERFESIADTAAPDPSGRRRLQDPGSRGLAALSWLAVIGVVGLVVLSHALVASSEPVSASDEPSSTSGVFTLMGRYAVGAVELARSTPTAQLEQTTDTLYDQLEGMAVTHDDHLRLALIAIELNRFDAAREQLAAAITPPTTEDSELDPAEIQESEAEPSDTGYQVPEYVFADAARIETLLDSGRDALSPDDIQTLHDHHGWFASIGLTAGMDANDPARQEALGAAMRVLYALLGLATLAFIGFLIGVVLLIVLIVRLMSGKLTMRYAPPAPGGSVYLETFALFLLAFVGVQLLADIVYTFYAVDISGALRWTLPLILVWPLFRGATRAQVKFALGWHRGEGVMKEIGAGLVGYMAGLPIVAIGILATFIMSFISAMYADGPAPPPSHPIVQDAGTSSVWGIISLYLLASVWAPLTEESMFRGALFHHLRGTLGALASALLVGFIFAIIHPQGILLVPPLMCLGFNFAMMREWRGSLIGPMVAHGLHNAVLVTVLIIAMS